MSKKLTKATDRGRKICITCGALLYYKDGEYHCGICQKDRDTLSLQLHVTKMLNEALKDQILTQEQFDSMKICQMYLDDDFNLVFKAYMDRPVPPEMIPDEQD